MKVHIGSGSVYLHGWLNVDVPSKRTYLASARPDLVQRYGTTESNYYGCHSRNNIVSFADGPLEQEYVCDVHGSFENIPVPHGTVTEVLARQSFEHISYTEAERALDAIDAVLAPGAVLRIDVPDHEETIHRLIDNPADTFYQRHLYGPRKDPHGFHVMSYTRSALIGLVEAHGFKFAGEEVNIHPYPAFCLRFIKPITNAPRDYAQPPYKIPAHWNVADIGPGQFPLTRANLYIDRDAENLKRLSASFRADQNHLVADISNGLPSIKDKYFDYVFCSHVLEHLEDPYTAAATLTRIAKRGTVVLPSAIKEGMFNFEEVEHKWLILPHPTTGVPIFVRRHTQFQTVIDTEVQRSMCRLYRTGPNSLEEARYLRQWYSKHEPKLDVIYHWHSTFEPIVVG